MRSQPRVNLFGNNVTWFWRQLNDLSWPMVHVGFKTCFLWGVSGSHTSSMGKV